MTSSSIDDFVHTSPASLPGGKERTLTLNALSKAYSMTGWRLGWIVGPADLMARVTELKAAISGGTSVISQYAGIAALDRTTRTGGDDGSSLSPAPAHGLGCAR